MPETRLETAAEGAYRVAGEMGFGTVPELAKAADSLFTSAASCLTVDLSAVSRADSAGIALLLEWKRRAAGAGKEIDFQHVPEQMLAIARLSGLEAILGLTSR